MVSVGGAEVLHGTTPRANMTLTRDITAFAALMPPGATVPVSVNFGTWVGWQKLSVTLDFYDEATDLLVERAHDRTLPVFTFLDIVGGGNGRTLVHPIAFPDAPPRSAIVEFTTSGHGQQGEFFYLHAPHTPPSFHVLVDNVEVGSLTAMPYVYALAGFGTLGCQHTDRFYNTYVHPAMWWGAQQALDVAGVHTGTGEIPPYRAHVPDDLLQQLTGTRGVQVLYDGSAPGDAHWWSSLTFHVDD
jgi:hypothetical protein